MNQFHDIIQQRAGGRKVVVISGHLSMLCWTSAGEHSVYKSPALLKLAVLCLIAETSLLAVHGRNILVGNVPFSQPVNAWYYNKIFYQRTSYNIIHFCIKLQCYIYCISLNRGQDLYFLQPHVCPSF